MILATISIQSSAQENTIPDRNAIKLFAALESMRYFADSLNLASTPDQLPQILSDYLLDWKITAGICTYVSPNSLSFRKSLIERVVREDVLQWIIDSENPAYDSLYDPVKLKEQYGQLKTMIYHPGEQSYCELPFMKLSIRNLARLRLATLKSNKQRIDR